MHGLAYMNSCFSLRIILVSGDGATLNYIICLLKSVREHIAVTKEFIPVCKVRKFIDVYRFTALDFSFIFIFIFYILLWYVNIFLCVNIQHHLLILTKVYTG